MAATIKRSFWPVYISVLAAVVLGSLFVGLFESYSTIDFQAVGSFLRDNQEILESFAEEQREARSGNGADEGPRLGPPDEMSRRERALEEEFEERLGAQVSNPVEGVGPTRLALFHILAIGFWLAPVYRFVYAKDQDYTEVVERRILNMSLVLLLVPWILGAADLGIKFIRQYQELGDFRSRNYAIYIASFIIFASLVSHFNLSITTRYVTNSIADQVFQGDLRYRMKRGFAISLSGRIVLLIVSIALMPLLINIFIPIVFNAWFIREISSGARDDWLQLAQIVTPIFVMVIANLYFILAQLFSIFAFRRNIQTPINTLVERMRNVARGDLTTRSSVLSGDEIGNLKAHFNSMVEGLQEREKLRDTFGRYVSMEIAEKLMASADVDLEGEEIETTVMFADIRSFTNLSERFEPRELVEFLNLYFSYMVTPILDNRGVVNKFIGDAVMAVFSPVFGVSDHARAALEAGLGMRESLAAFNGLGRYEPIRHGVGVHTGILVAGTVGTDERREYTVIGDTVNVASRIESQTKVYEADLLASAETVAALSAKARDSYHFTATEPITLRGKSEPMVLYRVNAWD